MVNLHSVLGEINILVKDIMNFKLWFELRQVFDTADHDQGFDVQRIISRSVKERLKNELDK